MACRSSFRATLPYQSYKMVYDGAISTLPSKQYWKSMFDDIQVEVPKSLRPRGRPKKRRFRSFLEEENKKKTSHKCSRCGLWGHHRSTCKNPLVEGNEEIVHSTDPATNFTPLSVAREKLSIWRGKALDFP